MRITQPPRLPAVIDIDLTCLAIDGTFTGFGRQELTLLSQLNTEPDAHDAVIRGGTSRRPSERTGRIAARRNLLVLPEPKAPGVAKTRLVGEESIDRFGTFVVKAGLKVGSC